MIFLQLKPERFEGHEIVLENEAKNILELNNGTVQEAKVTKSKFQLPFVCPQSNKDRISARTQHGLKAEKAIEKGQEDFKDMEEDADSISVSFKGKIEMSKSVEIGSLPKPKPEESMRLPQPNLKRRHPFFGLEQTPSPIVKSEKKASKKRKRSN